MRRRELRETETRREPTEREGGGGGLRKQEPLSDCRLTAGKREKTGISLSAGEGWGGGGGGG